MRIRLTTSHHCWSRELPRQRLPLHRLRRVSRPASRLGACPNARHPTPRLRRYRRVTSTSGAPMGRSLLTTTTGNSITLKRRGRHTTSTNLRTSDARSRKSIARHPNGRRDDRGAGLYRSFALLISGLGVRVRLGSMAFKVYRHGQTPFQRFGDEAVSKSSKAAS
jgi:hypothetical protein